MFPHFDKPVVAGGTGKYDSTRLFPNCGIFPADGKGLLGATKNLCWKAEKRRGGNERLMCRSAV